MSRILVIFLSILVFILFFLLFWFRQRNRSIESWKDLYFETLHREIDPITSSFFSSLSLSRIHRFLRDYHRQSSLGLAFLQKRHIVITGLMRNCRSNVANLRSWFDRFSMMTRHRVQIVIVENDSTDGTRAALLQWSITNPQNVIVLCPDGSVSSTVCHTPWIRTQSEFSKSPLPSRIRTMARLRRVYHQYITTSMTTPAPDYVLVMDLDLVGTLYTDGMAHSLALLETNALIDAVACNGRYYHPQQGHPYYDSFAFQGRDEPLGFKTHNEKIRHDTSTIHYLTRRLTHDMSLLPVRSAFGGACLYRWDAFQTHSYDEPASGSTRLVCEHALFHQGMEIVINPCFVFLIFSNLQ